MEEVRHNEEGSRVLLRSLRVEPGALSQIFGSDVHSVLWYTSTSSLQIAVDSHRAFS